MSYTPIFRGSAGLNTVIDPLRLPYDPESGVMPLSVAVNVVVDETGQIKRRKGYTRVQEGSWHSLFYDGTDCVGVKDGDLCVIAEDLSYTSIRSGFSSVVSYAQVNDAIYYTSPDLFGIVKDGIHRDWEAQDYIGPETDREFSGPFPANHIAFYLGRIWLATDFFVVFSEPFGWSWFDLHGSILPMDSRIRMLQPVSDGIYISTDMKTYFLSGSTPDEFQLSVAASFPAIEHSAATRFVNADDIGFDSPAQCALWASHKGACLGMPGGSVFNLTGDKVVYPKEGNRGAGLVFNDNFIHAIVE